MEYTDQFLFGGLSFERGLNCLEQVLNDSYGLNESYWEPSCIRDYDPISETCWPPTGSNESVVLECEADSCLSRLETRTCLNGQWVLHGKDTSLNSFDKFIIACILLSVAFLVTILCVFTSRTIRDSCRWFRN